MTPTADLYDLHGEALEVLRPILRDFGGVTDAQGPIATVRCHEDNSLVGQAVRSPGDGRVLVVDGGGSLRCALVGDNLAQAAIDHGWAGLVVFGCVRDAALLAEMPIMVKALATIPRKSVKRGEGQRDGVVHFGDATFTPGHTLVADRDGVVVLPD